MRTAKAKKETSTEHKPGSTFFGKSSHGGSWSGSDQPFFGRQVIQPKLSIGQPNDAYEQEADGMADKVVQQQSHPDAIQTKCAVCGEKETLHKKAEEPEFLQPKLSPIQVVERKTLSFGAEKPVLRKCAECEKEEKLQAKANTNSLSASPTIESNLADSKGSGNPMPVGIRQQMETSFGADFSGVRIHTGNEAVQMNRSLQAQAFTHGNDIYFNSGKYDTNSAEGKHLLAHELTHTIQQGDNTEIHKQPLTAKEVLLRPNYEQTLQKTHNDSEYKLVATIMGKGKIWVRENSLSVVQAPNQGDVHIILDRQIRLETKDNSFYYIDYGGMSTINSATADPKEISRILKLTGKSLLKVTGNTTSFSFSFSGAENSGKLIKQESSISEEMAANLGNTSLQEVMEVFYGKTYVAQYQNLDEVYFDKALAFAKEAPGRQGVITSESQIDFANGTTALATEFDQKGIARIAEDDFKVKVLPVPVKEAGVGNEKFKLNFNDEIFILKEYNKNGQWFFIYTPDGRYGWVEHWGVAYGAPEKDALLYKVKKGDNLWELAKGQPQYAEWAAKPDKGFGKRTVINAIFFTNFIADRLRPFIGAVKSNITLKQASDSFQRLEESLKLKEDAVIWLPSKSFVSRLIKSGQISSGRLTESILQDIEEGIQALKDFTLGVAGFLAGVVVGFIGSIVDLLTGIVDLVKMIAKAIWYIVSGKLVSSIISFIEKIRTLTVEELKEFFSQTAQQFIGSVKQMVGDFVKNWTEGSTWDRWYFRGKVIGYILAEIVLAVLTAGGTLAKWLGKLGKVGALIADILMGKWDDLLAKLKNAKGVGKVEEGAKVVKKARDQKKLGFSDKEYDNFMANKEKSWNEVRRDPDALKLEVDGLKKSTPRKSTTPGYDVEIELPNGHVYRRKKGGKGWCRFSDLPEGCGDIDVDDYIGWDPDMEAKWNRDLLGEAEGKQAARDAKTQMPKEDRMNYLFRQLEKAREQYMGKNPSWKPRDKTVKEVIARMRKQKKVKGIEPDEMVFVKGPDGKESWYSIKEVDMGHHPTNAVDYWNKEGFKFGSKSPEVRTWMKDPDNYVLEHWQVNQLNGAKIAQTKQYRLPK